MLLSKLKARSISLFKFNIILAIWLGVFLNIAFYKKLHVLTPYIGMKAGLFIGASILIVVAFYHLVFQIFNWKWTAKPLAIILIFIGGFAAYTVNTLGVVITADQVQNLMQTDVAEARDVWSTNLVIWTLTMTILPITIILMVKIKSELIGKLLLKKIIASILSLVVIGGLLFAFYVDFAQIFRENRDLKGMISPQNMIGSFYSYYKHKAPKKNLPLVTYGIDAHFTGNSNTLPKLMVLVVGETARAESFSLNGYAKNTNPKLSQQEVINFTKASSCGTATAVSVPCMFSGMPRNDYDENLASHREGLLDIAKRAGYQVTWIDNNSGCKGTCDRVGEFKIPEPIKQKWCKDGECKDDILLDSLNAYLATLPKDDTHRHLIVLHQVGSHGPAYYKRTLPQFTVFKPTCDTNAIQGCSRETLINSYDNTIVYTDYILDSVINRLKTLTQYQTGFWYLSDHGESTGENGLYLHGAPYAIAPSQQTHIPMMMWFSNAWKQHAAKQVECLTQQRQHQRGQDNLFPTVLSLLDIKTKVINPENDMLQMCTNP